ncbi:hypothetical protein AVEN_207361-1 [Araneus ventricosus]|uniref:Uncharacterized protein n=1 Tax=Araneus ventricosus TaxID=182803 RepID=A0A4Y2HWS9_ARAVE|nr:hypothetical protein AVEN_207361-1 [Araneus ventricosus]
MFSEKYICKYSASSKARGGPVVRPRLWGQRAPGSKPAYTEDPLCMGLLHVKSYVEAKRLPVGVAWKLEEGCQRRCRPLTMVQNYEVRPNIALVLFKNGSLIKLNYIRQSEIILQNAARSLIELIQNIRKESIHNRYFPRK